MFSTTTSLCAAHLMLGTRDDSFSIFSFQEGALVKIGKRVLFLTQIYLTLWLFFVKIGQHSVRVRGGLVKTGCETMASGFARARMEA